MSTALSDNELYLKTTKTMILAETPMMDSKYVLLILVISSCQLPRTDSLECYSCVDAGDINDCGNTTLCQLGQACYLELRYTGQTPKYSLGCRDNQHCGTPDAGNAGLVGRDLYTRQTQDCYECCNSEYCNKHLCEHPKPSACIDDAKADCPWLNTVFNICKDIHHAKTECPKFCGLCTLVDGNWAEWSPWSQCDVTCENGTQSRRRTCTNPAPADGGLDCVGQSVESKTCVKQLCPVHGGWSKWSNWETCSVTCDIGIQRRHRNCSNPFPGRFGDHCFGEAMDDKLCMPGSCANGGWSSWATWSVCSVTCDVGFKSRSRTCTNPRPSSQGKACEGNSLDVTPCKEDICQIPMVAFQCKDLKDFTFSSNERFVFTTTMMNEGNGYDSTTGVFTAPVAGLYSFSIQLCTRDGGSYYIYYTFVAENKEIKRGYFRNDESYRTNSAEAVTYVNKGGSVFIKSTNGRDGTLFQDSYCWNTFSGFLIHS
ncbi:SCO-spondin-like [Mercenaria mercenaria]|uniref:SCO-spondin-like n=1 Tax=Mercenaria mercenaria TaxID=6596 RepID=UPI00234F4040|nr:SCO-spondin-like [Mercenaria mercenaria]